MRKGVVVEEEVVKAEVEEEESNTTVRLNQERTYYEKRGETRTDR